jgi:hypothetical protein
MMARTRVSVQKADRGYYVVCSRCRGARSLGRGGRIAYLWRATDARSEAAVHRADHNAGRVPRGGWE